jgi:hypothetical protein
MGSQRSALILLVSPVPRMHSKTCADLIYQTLEESSTFAAPSAYKNLVIQLDLCSYFRTIRLFPSIIMISLYPPRTKEVRVIPNDRAECDGLAAELAVCSATGIILSSYPYVFRPLLPNSHSFPFSARPLSRSTFGSSPTALSHTSLSRLAAATSSWLG